MDASTGVRAGEHAGGAAGASHARSQRSRRGGGCGSKRNVARSRGPSARAGVARNGRWRAVVPRSLARVRRPALLSRRGPPYRGVRSFGRLVRRPGVVCTMGGDAQRQTLFSASRPDRARAWVARSARDARGRRRCIRARCSPEGPRGTSDRPSPPALPWPQGVPLAPSRRPSRARRAGTQRGRRSGLCARCRGPGRPPDVPLSMGGARWRARPCAHAAGRG